MLKNQGVFAKDFSPNLIKIIARAAELLKEWTGDPSMDAYQTQDPNRVLNQAAAIFNAIKEEIKAKEENLTGNMLSQGTTPRRLTDLIGSLCDLTSGSGDKGTPVILIQGYFDNYTND